MGPEGAPPETEEVRGRVVEFLEEGRSQSQGPKTEQRLEGVLLEESPRAGRQAGALQRTEGEAAAWGHRRREWPAGRVPELGSTWALMQGGTGLCQLERIQAVL